MCDEFIVSKIYYYRTEVYFCPDFTENGVTESISSLVSSQKYQIHAQRSGSRFRSQRNNWNTSLAV